MARPRVRHIALSAGVLAVFLYAGICAFMFVAQDGLLFYPTKTDSSVTDALIDQRDAEPIELSRPGATLRGVLMPGRGDGPRPTVLIFGGNGSAILKSAASYVPILDAGWNVVMVPYRGYDQSSGEPSGEALLADALALFDHTATLPSVDATHIVPWGTSLGSGVAGYVATHRDVAGAILFSPYARLSAIAGDQYPWLPVSLLFQHEIATIAWAPLATTPALIVHGTADEMIAIDQGRALAQAWPDAQMVEVAGAPHNGLFGQDAAKAAVNDYLAGVLEG